MRAARIFLSLMELLKLQLLASYCFLLLPRPLPPLIASLGFFLTVTFDRALARTRLRRFSRLSLLFLGFAGFFVATYAAYRPAPLFGPGFLPRSAAEALAFFSVLAACALFSLRALWLSRRQVDHAFCVAQFDQGLALFLSAFFVAAILGLRNAFAERLALPYLLFGVLALGRAKSAELEGGGLSRPSRPSMLAALAAAFLLAALSVAALAPALLEPARRAAGSLKKASLEALRLFGLFLGWLLGSPPPLPAGGPGEGTVLLQPASAEAAGQAGRVVANIIMWILLGSVAVLLAAFAFVELRRLVRGLGSRAPAADEGWRLAAALRRLAASFRRLLRSLARQARGLVGGRGSLSEAQRCYARLLLCGRRAGAGQRAVETPREYGLRLALLFPTAARDACFVVEALEREVYGGQSPDAETRARLASIRRRTRPHAFLAEGLGQAFAKRGQRGSKS